jgi:hypothetical protein
MSICKVCVEKQIEIDRILKAYGRDKKMYLIIIGVLLIALLYGEERLFSLTELLK